MSRGGSLVLTFDELQMIRGKKKVFWGTIFNFEFYYPIAPAPPPTSQNETKKSPILSSFQN
jgi:hypothetical protein